MRSRTSLMPALLIAAAHAAGLTHLRLIDHVRVSTTWVPEFVAAVSAEMAATEDVAPGLAVLTGVEAKLLSVAGDIDLPVNLEGIDAVVLADHQFPGTDGPWSPNETRERIDAGLSPADALEQFVEASIAAMIGFDHDARTLQLAHWFSILPKVGLSEDALTDEQLRRWSTTASATGTLVEVNEKWNCPGVRVIRAARAAGAQIVAATDSHVATEVGRYDAVAALLLEEVAGR